MLGGTEVRQIIELHAQGKSIREIAKLTGQSRNSVRKYLRAPGIPVARARPKRGSLLTPFQSYLDTRLREGVDNAVVLLRELRQQGYPGGYTTVKSYLHPRRITRQRVDRRTVRFETDPGHQAQVDFGQYRYLDPEGRTHRVWAFVMVLGWSRALYVEFIRKADTSAFLRCHVNAFEFFGGVPDTALYDNTKLVVLSRQDDGTPVWNERFLDFSLRVGFRTQLCQPYRPRTKGKVERGVGYVEGNFWPTARFLDLDDLNDQARVWLDTVANLRVHGTTREQPTVRLQHERSMLRSIPDRLALRPVLCEVRKVGWDGFVSYDGAYYGVPWAWSGLQVEVVEQHGQVRVYHQDEELISHTKVRPGERQVCRDQTMTATENSPGKGKAVVARQLVAVDVQVQERSLAQYAALGDVVSGAC